MTDLLKVVEGLTIPHTKNSYYAQFKSISVTNQSTAVEILALSKVIAGVLVPKAKEVLLLSAKDSFQSNGLTINISESTRISYESDELLRLKGQIRIEEERIREMEAKLFTRQMKTRTKPTNADYTAVAKKLFKVIAGAIVTRSSYKSFGLN